MKTSQIVTFVVDKELDNINYFNARNSYKRHKERGNASYTDENLEKLLKLNSEEEIRKEVEKITEPYYKQEEKLASLANDINKEWLKIEKDFMKKLETIHKSPFPYKSIRGILTLASRCGYNAGEGGWFATSLFRNKFIAMDTAMHELMHFMFHKYYDKVCEEKGLSKEQMWDVKESFTVLLNIEFGDLRFQVDEGYFTHKKIREIIKTSWEQNRDFDKALNDAIEFVKSNNISTSV